MPIELRITGPGGAAPEPGSQLSRRVASFDEYRRVKLAREYKGATPGSEVTDLYMVGLGAGFGTELHLVAWYDGDGREGIKWHQRLPISTSGLPPEVKLVDVDGDGSTEALCLISGANAAGPLIVDFSQGGGQARFDGLDWLSSGYWRFLDLDGDGTCECVEVVSSRDEYERIAPSDADWPEFRDGKTAYLLYHIVGDEYVLKEIAWEDPVDDQ